MRDQITNDEIDQLKDHIESTIRTNNEERKKIVNEFKSKHSWVTVIQFKSYKSIDYFRELYGKAKAFNSQMIYTHIINGVIRSRTKKYLELVKKVMK